MVNSLHLFSSNEQLQEINSSYLQFISILFFYGNLLLKYTGTTEGVMPEAIDARMDLKSRNLQRALIKVCHFLTMVNGFGGILSKPQELRLQAFQNPSNPSPAEIMQSTGDATSRRAQKIAEFKEERSLAQKLLILDEYYSDQVSHESDHQDPFATMDEEVVRTIYTDQLKYHSIQAFALLDNVAMELQVLANRPPQLSTAEIPEDKRIDKKLGAFDYTPRVEKDPTKLPGVQDLINKLGRVLQPFVLTNKRNDLRKKVFGTGQVLPSMSVEDYLDYELANGKMLKSEEPKNEDTDESDIDSDEELHQREWDDWKDDNPKGSGNMKANLG